MHARSLRTLKDDAVHGNAMVEIAEEIPMTEEIRVLPELTLETLKAPAEIVVRCSGKVVEKTASALQKHLSSLLPGSRCVVLDLAGVSSFDGTGLSAVAEAWSTAQRHCARLEILWSREARPFRAQ